MQRVIKITSLLLCLVLVFGLAACGGDVNEKEKSEIEEKRV